MNKTLLVLGGKRMGYESNGQTDRLQALDPVGTSYYNGLLTTEDYKKEHRQKLPVCSSGS